MKFRTVLMGSLLAVLAVMLLYASGFAACTCWVRGQVTLHYTCQATTIGLWAYEPINIEQTEFAWVLKGQQTLMDNEPFIFTVECGFGACNGPAEIRSQGDCIHQFTLPGMSDTAYVGTIYDPHHCSKVKKIDLPPPGQ